MSIESDLFDRLGPLVGGRCYPDVFPQRGDSNLWPAIRYVFVTAVPDQTVCGSGDDLATDFTIQIDGVALKGIERDALRIAIMAAMLTYPIFSVCESWEKSYDSETKAYRIRLDYLLQPSSS